MIKAILDGGLTKDLYYWFMTMHTYPQTLIYQHGCNPTSIDRNLFALEIYRGRLNWDQIADCAALDAANSSISRVKEFLAELLDKTQ